MTAAPPPPGVVGMGAAMGSVSGDFMVASADDGTMYIEIPEGTGTNYDPSDGTTNATFHLRCLQPTNITFVGVVWAPHGDSNSVYLAMDCGATRTWDLGPADTGYGEGWVTDTGGDGKQSTFYDVSAGNHTVTVIKREDGVRLMAVGFFDTAPCRWYTMREDLPTHSPTMSPTAPTSSPTGSPTVPPTRSPTEAPTGTPTGAPTWSPTGSPTSSPTVYEGELTTLHHTHSPGIGTEGGAYAWMGVRAWMMVRCARAV